MQIETLRLQLRPWTMDDLEPLASMLADPEVMEFSVRDAVPFEEVQGWLVQHVSSHAETGRGFLAVVEHESGLVIGRCGLLTQSVEDVIETEVAYMLQQRFWGRGYATEAAQAVRDHGFLDHGLDRLVSLIVPENVRSRRVAVKNGMHVEKQVEWHGVRPLVYAISRESWEEARASTGE